MITRTPLARIGLALGLSLPLAGAGCSHGPRASSDISSPASGSHASPALDTVVDTAPDACAPDGDEFIGSANPPATTHVCKGKCLVQIGVDHAGKRSGHGSPLTSNGGYVGLTPADLHSAYKVPDAGFTGSGPAPTIAIVVSGDNPNAESDLNAYRTLYGLGSCTASDGCFTKVNGAGASNSLPPVDPDDPAWTTEIVSDIEVASAVCPACKLLLLEAGKTTAGASYTLYDAVDAAAKAGAAVISNSWLDPQSFGDRASEAKLNHGGVFFSGGDEGYCAEPCTPKSTVGELPFPASSPFVWSVGGTVLKRDPTKKRGWKEQVWNQHKKDGATGSGCVAGESTPSWQLAKCAGRATNDVSANADASSSGIWILDTFGHPACASWYVASGTSVATVIVASIFAATGHAGVGPQFAYAHPEMFFDVDDGNDEVHQGDCKNAGEMCTAQKGWDGPSGLGSPNGALLGAEYGSTSALAQATHGGSPQHHPKEKSPPAVTR